MELAKYTPLILTLVCVLVAVVAQRNLPKNFWLATTLSAGVMVFAVLAIMSSLDNIYFKIVSDSGEITYSYTFLRIISVLVLFHGFIVSALTGIVMKKFWPSNVETNA